jgi:tripartite-type tricarboxylate transporter receptor subunit TctC
MVLRYDLERDLTPISIVATVPYVFVIHPSVPAQSMQELVGYARAKPGHLSYGSSGAGAPQRLAAEMFKLKTGVDMLHVPYKGGAAR